jgi:deoxyhypusine monooxygenase
MVATVIGDEAIISKLKCKLEFGGLTLPQKYRILFSLRNCSNASALDALLIALRDDSALLRHDIAFAIGQRQDAAAVKELSRILEDSSEHCMVRHEAGEALGAIGTPECMEPLERQADSDVREVSETCVLAKQRMEHFEGLHGTQEAGRYLSVDPTPPYPSATPLEELERIFLDEDAKLFDRYRALFALRNRGGDAAINAMATCMQSSGSALLKHEIAFVLGQMLDKRAIECLKSALQVRCTGPRVVNTGHTTCACSVLAFKANVLHAGQHIVIQHHAQRCVVGDSECLTSQMSQRIWSGSSRPVHSMLPTYPEVHTQREAGEQWCRTRASMRWYAMKLQRRWGRLQTTRVWSCWKSTARVRSPSLPTAVLSRSTCWHIRSQASLSTLTWAKMSDMVAGRGTSRGMGR